MEEAEYEEQKKHFQEKWTLMSSRVQFYSEQLQAEEAALDLMEGDCAVLRSQQCLQAFDKVWVARKRYERASGFLRVDCIVACMNMLAEKYQTMDMEDLPMRNETEKVQYVKFDKCNQACENDRVRRLYNHLQYLREEKEKIASSFLSGGKDPRRVVKYQ